MLHVRNVERSIEFYTLLGFTLNDTEGCGPLSWARMHCDDGSAVMLLLAEEPDNIDANKQAIMLVLYTPDLPAFRAHLLANGIDVPAIDHPGYMPSGTLHFRDPDGFIISVNHWSDVEHQQWLRQLEQKRAAGKLQQ